METNPVDERMRFAHDVLTGQWSMTEFGETWVLAARRQYGWGAKKLLQVPRTRLPDRVWPAHSTLNALLERHGLLRKHRRQRRWSHPGATALHTDAPNQVWPADMAALISGGGLGVTECCALPVNDVNLDQGLVVVRSGKGDKEKTCEPRPGARSTCSRRPDGRKRSRLAPASDDPKDSDASARRPYLSSFFT